MACISLISRIPLRQRTQQRRCLYSKASIPDVVLLNQHGEQIRFYSDLVKNKVVTINFIFTTCTTICPPMGTHFSKLQKLMGEFRVLLR